MRAEDFTAKAPGRLTRTIGEAISFVPHPAPRALPLDGATIKLLGRSEHRFGELVGAARRAVAPWILGFPLLRKEAILSSQIEGTIATPEQLVLLDVGTEPQTADAREVQNFVEATEHALRAVESGDPITGRLLLQTHRILMTDVRGDRERPGEYRDTQNWIGRPGQEIQAARFVPPPHLELPALIGDLEHLVNDDQPELPHIARAAIAHYQFEAIHPFRDGNGRIGRLLITLLLIRDGLLSGPFVPVSVAFERRRDEYADHLLAVSRTGDWLPWLRFFAECMIESTEVAIQHVEILTQLRDEWHARFQDTRSSARLLKLLDDLFKHPATTITRTSHLLKVTPASASANIEKLVEAGILKEITGRVRDRVYLAPDILKVMRADSGRPLPAAITQ